MNWCPFEFIGKTFGEDRVVPEYGDPTDFQPGIIVDGGICYMQLLKKLFIPCYLRSENYARGGVCSPEGVNDSAQRCKPRRRRAKKRRCLPITLQREKPPCPRKECPPKPEPEKPPEEKLPEEKPIETPKPEETEKPTLQPVLCPNCSKPTTIIICDSCNTCHKMECTSK